MKPRHQAKADFSRQSEAKERKACSERRRGGGFILNVSMGPAKEIKRKPTFRDRAK